MKDEDYQILYGMLRVIKENEDTRVIVMPKHENLENEMLAHPTCFVTKKVYSDFGMYDIKYRSCADHDFMLRMRKHSEVVFIPVYKLLANFTEGTGMSAQESSILEALGMLAEHGIISKTRYRLILMKNRCKKLLGLK